MQAEEHDDFHTPEALSIASSLRGDGDDMEEHAEYFSAEEGGSVTWSDEEDTVAETEFGLDALDALARGLIGRSPGKNLKVAQTEQGGHVHGHGAVLSVSARRHLPLVEGENVASDGETVLHTAREPGSSNQVGDTDGISSRGGTPAVKESGAVDAQSNQNQGDEKLAQIPSEDEDLNDEAQDKVMDLVPSQASSEVAPSDYDDEFAGPVHAFAQSASLAVRLDVQQLQTLLKQHPKAVREVDTEGRLPVHCLAQNRRAANEHDVTLLQMFLKNEREANQFDVMMLKIVLERRRDTAKQQDGDGMHPLHSLAFNQRKSTEHDFTMLKDLLHAFPAAAKARSRERLNAVHCLCKKKGEGTQSDALMLQALLEAFPGAAKNRDAEGRYPLHCLCRNERPANEYDSAMLEALLQAFPDAVQAKDDEGLYPFNCMEHSEREPTAPHFIMSETLLKAFPAAEQNEGQDQRNSWPLRGPREEASDNICSLS